MGRYARHDGYIGLARQSAKGTAVTPTLFLRWTGKASMTPEQDIVKFREGGDGQYSGIALKRLHKPDGSFDLLARPQMLAALMGLCLGRQVSTGTVEDGAASTTLASRLEKGLKYLHVASATGFEIDDYVEFGAAFDTEVRKVTAVHTAAASGDTTLNGACAAGVTNLVVVSSTGFQTADYVSVGAGATLEIHKVASVPDATHIVLVDGLVNAKLDEVAVTEVTNVLEFAISGVREHSAGVTVVERQSPFTHVFTPCSLSSMPWATLERSIAGLLVNRFVDVRVQSVEITGKAGEPITLKVSYLAINETREVSAQTAVYESDMPFLFWQGVYTLDGDDASAKVTQFKATIINEFDNADQTNSYLRADIPLIKRDVTLSWTMKYDALSQYTKTYLAGTTLASSSVAASTGTFSLDLNYGSGDTARQFKVEIPNVYMTKAEVELDVDSSESQSYECEGYAKKVIGQELVEVTVKNDLVARWTDA